MLLVAVAVTIKNLKKLQCIYHHMIGLAALVFTGYRGILYKHTEASEDANRGNQDQTMLSRYLNKDWQRSEILKFFPDGKKQRILNMNEKKKTSIAPPLRAVPRVFPNTVDVFFPRALPAKYFICSTSEACVSSWASLQDSPLYQSICCKIKLTQLHNGKAISYY